MKSFKQKRVGFHSIEIILKINPHKIKKIFVPHQRKDHRIKELINLAEKNNISIEYSKKIKKDPEAEITNENELNFKDLKSFLESKSENNHLLLILDNIIDPRNLGACIRSAAVLGVDAVVINKHQCAPINDVVHNVSAGGVEVTKIFSVSNLVNCIKYLKTLDINIFGMSEHAKKNYHDFDLKESCAIIMGSEEHGIRQKTLEYCDSVLSLSDNKNFKSFNVSVATGIILAEVIKQRKC